MMLFTRDIERLKEIYTSKHTTYISGMLVRAHPNPKRRVELAAAGEALAEEIDLEEEEEIEL